MAESNTTLFPLAALRALVNANNQWVALMLETDSAAPDACAHLSQLFATPDLLAAIVPLDCVVAPGKCIYFTDFPSFPQAKSHLLRVAGAPPVVTTIESYEKGKLPNGIALSADGNTLFARDVEESSRDASFSSSAFASR